MKTFASKRDRMPTDNYCLYVDQQNFKNDYEELNKPKNTAVCIVGGGFTGVMTSIYLAQMGVENILIERHRIGWGASGRNSGQIIPGFNADPRDVVRKYGLEATKEIYRLNYAARNDILSNIEQHAPYSDYHRGVTIPALSSCAHEDQRDYAAFMKDSFDYKLNILDASETVKNLGSTFYCASMEDLNGGHFNPLKYINQMVAYAHKELGVYIYENTPAINIDYGDGYVEVETPYARIKAKKLILAGGGYLGNLIPQIRRKYVLLRTSMLATQKIDEDIFSEILPSHHAVYEWRKLLNYYAKTPDGRLIFGGGDSAVFSNKKEEQKAFQKIYNEMTKVFPQLKDIHVTHWWGGYIAVTLNDMPEIRRLNDNVLYATGFSGHGVVPTHMAAKLLSEMAVDDQMNNPMQALYSLGFPGNGKYDATLAKIGLIWAKTQDTFLK